MIKSLAGKAVIPVTLAVTGFVIVCCLLLYSIFKSDITNMATLMAGCVGCHAGPVPT